MILYHGTNHPLPIGEVLSARPSHDAMFFLLEKGRPPGAPSRRKTFYMVKDIRDLDLAGVGSGYRYIYEVEALSPLWCVDLNWTDIIDKDRRIEERKEEIEEAVESYWKGLPFPHGKPLWECLAEEIRPVRLVQGPEAYKPPAWLKAKLLR